MMLLSYLLITLYVVTLVCLCIYGINCYVMLFLYRFRRKDAVQRAGEIERRFALWVAREGLPKVTVQLPIYNEKYVVERLIKAVVDFRYPRELLEIQVLDDSTDETAEIVDALALKYAGQGSDIVVLRRVDRAGYKAGALKEGLTVAKGDFLAIFDADFVPPPDFLEKTLPYFVEPRTGMVQARWGHINRDYSLLTQVQSIGIDGHFGIEQPARAWGGLMMNFNGTAGIWRKQAIEDAGGWHSDTLTEDMDLSYRAQLAGWKLEFTPTLTCPAELPVDIHAFKAQQHRWAKGSIQTAKKLLGPIFRAKLPLFVKVEAFLHLTHYLVHPLMLIVVLTSLPLLFTQWFYKNFSYPLLVLTLFTLATCGPSSLYFSAQRLLYPNWRKHLRYLPFLVIIGTGIAVSNTRAILEALWGPTGTFIRTPKYGIEMRNDNWRKRMYRSPVSLVSILELLMGSYSLLALILFVTLQKYFISPFLFIYAVGFFYISFLSLAHSLGRAR